MADANPKTENPIKRAPYLPVVEASVVGAAAGLSAIILLHGIKWLTHWRLEMSAHYSPYVVLPLMGLFGGLVAGMFVELAPEVAGSGIPQVRATLNYVELKLDLKSAIAKLISGVITLGCGFFMGREGPAVQIGAAMAAQFTRWRPTTPENRRQLIASGAGAGLAAAFNAPLAGVVFVMEELLKEASSRVIAISLIACFAAAVALNLTGDPREQSLLHASGPAVPLHFHHIIFYIALGLMAALFGALFNELIIGSLRIYKRTNLPVIARTALAGIITGFVVAALPPVLHNYAETREFINSGAMSPELVPLAFVALFFLVLVAYGSGAPGGLFAPSLVLGAALGYIVGYADWSITGTDRIPVFTQVGMGAMFAAVARVPLTATMIIFEMSGNFGLIPPLMLATVIASHAADRLSKGSIYDLLLAWIGINLPGAEPVEETTAS